MKYMRMLLLFLVFLSASSVFAIIDIQGGVWLLSTLGGTNATVAETLTRIENDPQIETVSEEDIFNAKYAR